MWVFLTRRVRRWLLFTVGLPLIAAALRRIGERMEARNGRTRTSDALQRADRVLRRRQRRTADAGPASSAEQV